MDNYLGTSPLRRQRSDVDSASIAPRASTIAMDVVDQDGIVNMDLVVGPSRNSSPDQMSPHALYDAEEMEPPLEQQYPMAMERAKTPLQRIPAPRSSRYSMLKLNASTVVESIMGPRRPIKRSQTIEKLRKIFSRKKDRSTSSSFHRSTIMSLDSTLAPLVPLMRRGTPTLRAVDPAFRAGTPRLDGQHSNQRINFALGNPSRTDADWMRSLTRGGDVRISVTSSVAEAYYRPGYRVQSYRVQKSTARSRSRGILNRRRQRESVRPDRISRTFTPHPDPEAGDDFSSGFASRNNIFEIGESTNDVQSEEDGQFAGQAHQNDFEDQPSSSRGGDTFAPHPNPEPGPHFSSRSYCLSPTFLDSPIDAHGQDGSELASQDDQNGFGDQSYTSHVSEASDPFDEDNIPVKENSASSHSHPQSAADRRLIPLSLPSSITVGTTDVESIKKHRARGSRTSRGRFPIFASPTTPGAQSPSQVSVSSADGGSPVKKRPSWPSLGYDPTKSYGQGPVQLVKSPSRAGSSARVSPVRENDRQLGKLNEKQKPLPIFDGEKIRRAHRREGSVVLTPGTDLKVLVRGVESRLSRLYSKRGITVQNEDGSVQYISGQVDETTGELVEGRGDEVGDAALMGEKGVRRSPEHAVTANGWPGPSQLADSYAVKPVLAVNTSVGSGKQVAGPSDELDSSFNPPPSPPGAAGEDSTTFPAPVTAFSPPSRSAPASPRTSPSRGKLIPLPEESESESEASEEEAFYYEERSHNYNCLHGPCSPYKSPYPLPLRSIKSENLIRKRSEAVTFTKSPEIRSPYRGNWASPFPSFDGAYSPANSPTREKSKTLNSNVEPGPEDYYPVAPVTPKNRNPPVQELEEDYEDLYDATPPKPKQARSSARPSHYRDSSTSTAGARPRPRRPDSYSAQTPRRSRVPSDDLFTDGDKKLDLLFSAGDAKDLSTDPSKDGDNATPGILFSAGDAKDLSTNPSKDGDNSTPGILIPADEAKELPTPSEDCDKATPSLIVSLDGAEDIPATPSEMASVSRLQVRGMNEPKIRAVEDAKKMQNAAEELCAATGRSPPKYQLMELIGKGSFGRVYMGTNTETKDLVAVKVLNMEEADMANPKGSDAFSDIQKEITALRTLRDSSAKNINVVIEAEHYGSTVWLVTEYCSGGSISTLMKPTAPNGLGENWVIPIVREVAEGIMWVHKVGLIHRDIKAANVLITEQGSLQLCDFGVAGIAEGKLSQDKRTTIIGTPHWMAPELLLAPQGASYGKEIDIWAFGALIFEIATGAPPHVKNGLLTMDAIIQSLESAENAPRLEGDQYSDELKDIIACCLERDIEKRPTIEKVQEHKYIANTKGEYPTASLVSLVVAYRVWTDQGGSRKSLFQQGGAAEDVSGLSAPALSDDWNFSTTTNFDAQVSQISTSLDIDAVYAGNAVEFKEDTVRPKQTGRRRPPPEALARLPPPLAKVFDPNTLSDYKTSSQNHYNMAPQQYNQPPPDLHEPPPSQFNFASDLPLRSDTGRTSTRESMIDLGGHDMETGLSSFPDMGTIKPGARQAEDDGYSDFHRPALSDPADINPNRRTQDWKFPSMAPPASADPEVSRFPASSYELPRPTITPGSGGRPTLVHHPTEPLGGAFGGGLPAALPNMDRRSVAESLIDLDMSMPDSYSNDMVRPSTANSDVGSTSSEHLNTNNPFEFERHVSYVAPNNGYEPSLYLEEDTRINLDRDSRIDLDMALDPSPSRDINDISDFSEPEGGQSSGEYTSMGPGPTSHPTNLNQTYTFDHFPSLGAPPSSAALAGTASREEMSNELSRALATMEGQLEAFRDVFDSPAIKSRSGGSGNGRRK